MSRVIVVFFVLFFLFSLASCADIGGDSLDRTASFDISDGVAFGLVSSDSSTARFERGYGIRAATEDSIGVDACRLTKIDVNGQLLSACEGVDVLGFEVFLGGVFVYTSGENYIVLPGSEPYAVGGASYVGQNSEGDIILSDAQIFRMTTKTMEWLNTTLSDVSVQSISGNFAVLQGGAIYQVFDTVSTARYNIQGCNGPRVAALNNEMLIVNDCSHGSELMNIVDGSRSASAIGSFNHETVSVDSGAVFLSQSCPGSSGNYWLCHVDPEGIVTPVLSAALTPGSSSCMNCGSQNDVLFGGDGYFVVRETGKVTAVAIGVDSPISILSGLNVVSVSIDGTLVYYAAEDNFGNGVTGVYDLSTNSDTRFPFSVRVERIQAARH